MNFVYKSVFSFRFAVCLLLYGADNPMVVLGYPQGRACFFDYLAQNGDGDQKMDMGVAVDPRDFDFAKYVKLFPDVDEYERETMFEEMKQYGKAALMNMCFTHAEKGSVNNCPFAENDINGQYKIDISAINPKYEGL